jgi:hypothetical protein
VIVHVKILQCSQTLSLAGVRSGNETTFQIDCVKREGVSPGPMLGGKR